MLGEPARHEPPRPPQPLRSAWRAWRRPRATQPPAPGRRRSRKPPGVPPLLWRGATPPPRASPGTLPTWGRRCSSPQMTAPAAEELWKSDGTKAGTVLVKDIKPGDSSYGPFLLDRCRRRALLRRQRLLPRPGTVEVGRHQGGHRPGQGHRARQRRLRRRGPVVLHCRGRRALLHRGRSHPRPGAVEVGRHHGRHRPGQGHQARPPRQRPLEPGGRGQQVVLHRQRRRPRSGAVEVGRHQGRHRPGQGHQGQATPAAMPRP